MTKVCWISTHLAALSLCLGVPCWSAAAQPLPSPDLGTAVAQYRAYRSGVAAWFRKNPHAMGLDTPPTDSIRFNPAMQPFEIEPAQEGASDSPLDSQLLHLARTTGMLRAQLRAAQYPVSLYEQPIRLYERESVQMLLAGTPETTDNRIKALVASIDQARQRQRPDLPVVRYGLFSAMINPVPTIFRSSRLGGRVWIITQLRFEVCRAQFSNPFDLARCTKWRETDPQNPLSLSGTYIYQVNWNPGGNARGMRTVERGNAPPPVIYRVP